MPILPPSSYHRDAFHDGRVDDILAKIEADYNGTHEEVPQKPSYYELVGGRLKEGDLLTVIGVSSITLACVIASSALLKRLWSREGSVFKKAFWSFIVLLPIFGWLAYFGLYRAPKKHASGSMSPVNAGAFYGGSGAP